MAQRCWELQSLRRDGDTAFTMAAGEKTGLQGTLQMPSAGLSFLLRSTNFEFLQRKITPACMPLLVMALFKVIEISHL